MKQQIIALSKVPTVSLFSFKSMERLSQQFVCSFRTVATSCATLLQEFNSASISKRQTQLLWPFCLKIPIQRRCDLSSFQKCDTIIQAIRSTLTSYIFSNTFTYLWLHFRNRVKEDEFWRNYFYRVSLIKQSAQLTSLAQSGSHLLNLVQALLKLSPSVSSFVVLDRIEVAG